MKKKILIFCILLLIGLQTNGLSYQRKRALIIGNEAYKQVPLFSPVNDANAMASTLKHVLGFSVTKKINMTQQEMEDAIRNFSDQIETDDIALFYYSGHGVQVHGVNYLIPIEADIYSEDEIKYKAVAVDMLLDKLEKAENSLNIVILDACRNNPFKRVRSLSQGLAGMSGAMGTLIAYATAPGTVAYDGDFRHSPYTKHLLWTMITPELKIEDVFKKVRVAVMSETQKKQIPWESSSLTKDFYFLQEKTEDFIWPYLRQTIPSQSTPGSEIKVIGGGGYIKLHAGGHIESARIFDLYFDGKQVDTISCMTNYCQTRFTIPSDTKLGTHIISVDGGHQLEIQIVEP